MRIAILLSGHVRSYQKTLNNFEQNFINNLEEAGHEYDVFISTWDNDGMKRAGGGHSQELTNNSVNIAKLKNSLNKSYQPKKLEIEENNDYLFVKKHVGKILKKYPKLKNEKIRYNVKQHVEGILCQLYKIKKSFNLIDDISQYDVIVKYRFDLFIKNKVDWSDKQFVERITEGLYLKTKNKLMPDGTINWGDTIVIGPCALMKYFCMSYDYITSDDITLQLRKNFEGDVDIFSPTHIVNSVFQLENIKDKLCLYSFGEYHPWDSGTIR